MVHRRRLAGMPPTRNRVVRGMRGRARCERTSDEEHEDDHRTDDRADVVPQPVPGLVPEAAGGLFELISTASSLATDISGHLALGSCHRPAKPTDARTQGAFVAEATGATEDAAARGLAAAPGEETSVGAAEIRSTDPWVEEGVDDVTARSTRTKTVARKRIPPCRTA